MNIAGEYSLPGTPLVVWQALHDLEVLREAVPGCKTLEETGPGLYTGSATVGIAMIKGLYRGTLRLLEEREPSFARVQVEARSGHAEIHGEGSLQLEPSADWTRVLYEGQVQINGPMATVGQRLLPSASKSLTEQFFRNLEQKLLAAAV